MLRDSDESIVSIDVGMLESEMAKMLLIRQKCYSYARVYCYAIIFKQRKLSSSSTLCSSCTKEMCSSSMNVVAFVYIRAWRPVSNPLRSLFVCVRTTDMPTALIHQLCALQWKLQVASASSEQRLITNHPACNTS